MNLPFDPIITRRAVEDAYAWAKRHKIALLTHQEPQFASPPSHSGLGSGKRADAMRAVLSAFEADLRGTDGLRRTEDLEVLLRRASVASVAAGWRGRWNEVTQEAWGRAGAWIREDYRALRSMTAKLRQETITRAQFRAWARTLEGSLRSHYEASRLSERGVPVSLLPGMPGRGTWCFRRCGCRWVVSRTSKRRGELVLSWRRGKRDSCTVCLRREAEWGSVVIRGGALTRSYEVIDRNTEPKR